MIKTFLIHNRINLRSRQISMCLLLEVFFCYVSCSMLMILYNVFPLFLLHCFVPLLYSYFSIELTQFRTNCIKRKYGTILQFIEWKELFLKVKKYVFMLKFDVLTFPCTQLKYDKCKSNKFRKNKIPLFSSVSGAFTSLI